MILSLMFKITGPINCQPTNIRTKIAARPIISIERMTLCTGSGAKAYNNLDPSSGGNGIILNTKSATLIRVNITTKSDIVFVVTSPSRNTNPLTQANAKFVNGPAIPISAAPNSSNRTRIGLNGTGFAAKIGGKPTRTITNGNNTVVNISMCLSGLSVSLPSSAAVSSPSQCPVNACIAS